MIDANEVAEVLEKVGNGYLVPKLFHNEKGTTDGDVIYIVGKWKIKIFMDGGGFDYVASAISPDGRIGDFDEWNKGEGVSAPECILGQKNNECYERMERIFEVVAGLHNE